MDPLSSTLTFSSTICHTAGSKLDICVKWIVTNSNSLVRSLQLGELLKTHYLLTPTITHSLSHPLIAPPPNCSTNFEKKILHHNTRLSSPIASLANGKRNTRLLIQESCIPRKSPSQGVFTCGHLPTIQLNSGLQLVRIPETYVKPVEKSS